ncbi:hypothetical protein J6590_090570 [Homalodisca vitripennis]|nr:hypothetical protein J6590_090263 [Homalodisca vitripennis]KAG8293920.1 hypothetical protein J6590_007585 [Homalodisca vitripennis]KAG8329255.1 hypothetical protein J6590_090570 [Homalodisca vitripennis]
MLKKFNRIIPEGKFGTSPAIVLTAPAKVNTTFLAPVVVWWRLIVCKTVTGQLN